MNKELPKLDYKPYIKKQLQENIQDLIENSDSEQYQRKIQNFVEKFELDKGEVFEKFNSDYMFALFFVKDPSRQSIHEKTAANFIRSLNKELDCNIFQNFKKLPSSGKNTLFVSNGNVIKNADRSGKSDGKSIDFYWEYNYNNQKLKFYASHKYTGLSGGSQDNQRADIEAFMKGARVNRSKDQKFYAITDGPYYTKIIDELNDLYSNYHVKAITINILAYDVCKTIKNWLIDTFEDKSLDEIKKLDLIINKYENEESSN